jgi:hypothetical protein
VQTLFDCAGIVQDFVLCNGAIVLAYKNGIRSWLRLLQTLLSAKSVYNRGNGVFVP